MSALIGLIANPASGKDIRRLVAHASVFDNAEKRSIIRRVMLGAMAAGAMEFVHMPDDHALVERALEGIAGEVRCVPVTVPGTATALDTMRAAEQMRAAGCAVVVTLGGDGTNRAAALGWRDLPLIPISTGTNNVFPTMLEGTLAGSVAGLVATGRLPLHDIARQAKTVRVEVEEERNDLALIDAVLLEGSFVGSRALWDVDALRLAVLARAEPAATGISAVGGLLDPVRDGDDCGLVVEFGGAGMRVRAPIAPGLFRDLSISGVRGLALGESVIAEGPGILALDGERERPLKPGRQARLTVRRDGPLVIDVRAALDLAARLLLFVQDVGQRSAGLLVCSSAENEAIRPAPA